jgi:heat shock protein HtpX
MNTSIAFQHKTSNIIKTWLLMAVVGVVVISIGFVFSQYFQSSLILYGFVAASIIFNIAGYWFSDKVALRMHKAQEITMSTHPDLVARVKTLADRAGLPMPKVYLIDDPAPNAFATGRNPRNSAVAMTTGIVRTLSQSELDGVIAHELAHIGNRDILLSTVVVILVGAVSIVADFISHSTLFGGGSNEEEGRHPFFFVAAIAVSLAIPIAGMIMQMAISRRREYLADATGALITRQPRQLAFALQKIGSSHQRMHEVHQSTAHLFFASPVGADSSSSRSERDQFQEEGGLELENQQEQTGIMSRIFSTHPPMQERIKRLEAMSL